MKNTLLLFFLCLLSFCSYGQGRQQIGTQKDTVIVPGTLRLPQLTNTGNKVLTTDPIGRVVLVPQEGGAPGLTDSMKIVRDSLDALRADIGQGGGGVSADQVSDTADVLRVDISLRAMYFPELRSRNGFLSILGDSYRDSVYDGNTYVKYVGDSTGLHTSNRAVQGTGMLFLLYQQFNYTERWKRKAMLIFGDGLNDIRRSQPSANLNEFFERTYEAGIINALLDTAIGVSKPAVTKYGAWSAYAFYANGVTPSKAESIGDSAMLTTTLGDSLVYTFTNKKTVVVGYFRRSSYGWLEISVNGIVKDTIKPNVLALVGTTLDYNTYPAAKYYNITSSGTNKLKIKVISGNSSAWGVDYIGHLQTPDSAAPILISDIPYMAESGYIQTGATYGYATKLRIDEANYYIKRLVDIQFAQFSSKIRFFHPNEVLDIQTDYVADGVHLTNAGHIKLASEVCRVIKRFTGETKSYPKVSADGIQSVVITPDIYLTASGNSSGSTINYTIGLGVASQDRLAKAVQRNQPNTKQEGDAYLDSFRADKIIKSPVFRIMPNGLPASTTDTDSVIVRDNQGHLRGYRPVSYFLDRANHTGTQAIGTIPGLQPALEAKLSIDTAVTTLIDGSTITWDPNRAIYKCANLTITGTGKAFRFSNAITTSCQLVMKVTQGDGNDTITDWDSRITWVSGTAPTLKTASGAKDIITFWYDGTTMWGAYYAN